MRREAKADVGDDALFDVYSADDGRQFGLGHNVVQSYLVEGLPGALRVRVCSRQSAVSELSKRLRQGFRPNDQRMFFNPRSQRLTRIHPDMDWKGARVVLISRHLDIHRAAERVAEIAKSTPASCIAVDEVDAWLQQQRRNAAHVVAFDDHPIWALAIGELVFEEGWDWRPGPELDTPPSKRPSQAPAEWAQWLTRKAFKADAVAAAQAGLGWSLTALLNSDDSGPHGASLSALL